jgi:hypothetical protein
MRKILFALIIGMLAILAVSCEEKAQPQQANMTQPETKTASQLMLEFSYEGYTFEEGFAITKALDDEYKIGFHKEKLAEIMADKAVIDLYLNDLGKFIKAINQSKSNEETETLLRFLDARMSMLLSQKEYQLAAGIGKKGVVREDFDCANLEYATAADIHIDKAIYYAQRTMYNLDEVLQQKYTRQLIGLDQTKPPFYNSRLDKLKMELRSSEIILNEKCRGIKNNNSTAANMTAMPENSTGVVVVS